MSQNLKFRVWSQKENKWMFGYDYPNLGGFSLIGETVLMGEFGKYSLDRYFEDFIINQFTGKTDLKNREIYEGDVYFTEDEHDEGDIRLYFVCTWINEWSMFCWLEVHSEYNNYQDNGISVLEDDGTFGLETKRMHHAGNIYEKPELLK